MGVAKFRFIASVKVMTSKTDAKPPAELPENPPKLFRETGAKIKIRVQTGI
jgi:hypothetical protein